MSERNHRSAGLEEYLDLMQLRPLMSLASGSPAVSIGVIDGPVDLNHPAFASAQIRAAQEAQLIACQEAESAACKHGTFVTGILCAQRGSAAPALCPDCAIIVRPIFPEAGVTESAIPTCTPEELAHAIVETVDAGARVLNLSMGLLASALKTYTPLDAACDYARQRGVIVVAAAGNQGVVGSVPLLRHPWIIPVASCDAHGRVSPESNLGPSIGRRGLLAVGVDVPSTAPGGGYARLSGTSVAAPFVTGTIALLWSAFPQATAAEIQHALVTGAAHHRRTITPPLLNAEAAWNLLRALHRPSPPERRKVVMAEEHELEERIEPAEEGMQPTQEHLGTTVGATAVPPGQTQGGLTRMTPHPAMRPAAQRQRGRIVAQVGADCPTCAAAASAQGTAEPAVPIYALGSLRMRLPSLSIEKEFAQAVRNGQTTNLSDQQVQYTILRENRYLANEVCWVLSIEGVETYILVPRDPLMIEQFIGALAPTDQRLDVDVVIGVRGPVAPAEMCNGLMVPIVIVDQIYSFDRPALIGAMATPEGHDEAAFRDTASELFDRIQQMADNTGEMDEHRALNYLAVRYPRIYNHAAEMHGRDYSLTAIEVISSRLSGVRKLVDVVLSYTSRTTDVTEKYYVRIDVTEKFPFLEKALAPFYDR
jgi:hypothetical protein